MQLHRQRRGQFRIGGRILIQTLTHELAQAGQRMGLPDQPDILKRSNGGHFLTAAIRRVIQHINMIATDSLPTLFPESLSQPLTPVTRCHRGLDSQFGFDQAQRRPP